MGFCSNVWGEEVRDKFQFIAFQFTYQPWTLFFLIERLLILGSTGSSLLQGLFLVTVIEGRFFWLLCTGFTLQRLLLLPSMGSWHTGFRSCGTRVQYLWCMGLVAPWYMGSSQTRDGTRVSSIGRQIVYYWATRETLNFLFELKNSLQSFGCLYVFEKD